MNFLKEDMCYCAFMTSILKQLLGIPSVSCNEVEYKVSSYRAKLKTLSHYELKRN